MVNCSDLSLAVVDLAKAATYFEGVKNFDDVVKHIQSDFPELGRVQIAGAILEAQQAENAERQEQAVSLFTKIKAEALAEGRTKEIIDRLEKLEKEGAFETPTPKQKKAVNAALKQLRIQQAKLKRQSQLGKEVSDLEKNGLPVPKPQAERFADDPKISLLKRQREALKKKLGEPIKIDARVKELEDEIEAIKSGKLPETAEQQPKNPRIAALEKQRNDLLTAAREPEKLKARIENLNAQIKDLQAGKAPSLRERRAKNAQVAALEKQREALTRAAKEPQRIEQRAAQLEKQIEAIKRGEIARSKKAAPKNPRLAGLEKERDSLISTAQRIKTLDEKIAAYERGERPQGATVSPRQPSTPEVAQREAKLAQYKKKAKLVDRIAELTEALETGSLPEPKTISKSTDDAISRLEIERNRLANEVKWKRESLKPKTNTRKVLGPINAISSLIRTLMASGDLPPLLRQGLIPFFSNPIISVKAFKRSLPSLASEISAHRAKKNIEGRKNFVLYNRGKLRFSDWEGRMSEREEFFSSRLAELIPLIGRIIKAGGRAYTTYLNLLRADLFDAMVNGLDGMVTEDQAKDIARDINVATGMSDVSEKHAQTMTDLASAMWSPRLFLSRIQYFTLEPLWNAKDPKIRKMIKAKYIRALSGFSAAMTLYWLGGGDIEWEWISSDWLQMKFGNTRRDLTGGLKGPIVFLGRQVTGETKTAEGDTKEANSGFIAWRFIRSKFNPAISLGIDTRELYIKGEKAKDIVGKQITPGSLAKNYLLPMTPQDIVKGFEDQGLPGGLFLGMLSALGSSGSTYDNEGKK